MAEYDLVIRGGEVHDGLGGAPISADYAREIGADGYAADAATAVELFKRLLGMQDSTRAVSAAGASRQA